ncbi:MAG: GUN4 domain-containing protein, partial [Phormidesmis sp.]
TILLYAGLVNPTKLIIEAMRQELTDTAYACLQETRKRIDEELKAKLQSVRNSVISTLDGINPDYVIESVDDPLFYDDVADIVLDARYADLARYLKNGQWKEADGETYRLMITEVGKEVGWWFDREDLLNFPCEPLKAIDGLWVKHSGGKFGFSVQKEMYQECGGVPDGRYYEVAWSKLCQMNGWAVSIKFDLESPTGHLPALWEKGRGAWGCCFLFSHPDL